MRLSPFFEELQSAYDAELDDLLTDSAGHDVLAQRLRLKRSQLPELLPMIDFSPEMVAVAFHGGMDFSILSSGVMRDLLVQEDPEDLPSWDVLREETVHLQPWAAELAKIVRTHPNGERFLVVTACLEYLHGRRSTSSEPGDRRQRDDFDDDRSDADVDGDDVDLEEAGADWLAEQGFDRKDRTSGDN
ncbi:MAG: hypothetical protein AW10_02907 [Candidatus Accumulibacter appositus]|uniref:Uncharacterized protein n=1 Tax=Candidatus Accumulibacter appositus TaxID=1454003 RepID=A0A011PNV4_9PROT|nr:hypothetical protein [Accumulibacter sp.]EXI78555.1 MAG: hypothetical protein AW10_02907 [Candidatus Accumulibacter appositus]HRF03584.1 hypothetical protein [Accumulibacter sp.]